MKLKLIFVFLLIIYHFICQQILFKLKAGKFKWSSTQLRLWNELATLFLVIIVFLVELKDSMDWIKGTLGFVAVGLLLMISVKIYKIVIQKKAKIVNP
jgi:putative membrane protein